MKLSDSDVLYEDNHLLALHKPAGLLTQASGTDQDNLEDSAKLYLKQKYHKPGAVFLHAVHRLDKPVSGIVLFAKTSKALSRVNESLRNKACEKIYIAKVEGKMPQEAGTLESFLVHDSFKSEVQAEGKRAILHYQVEGDHVIIKLETGRYHQIRAQLAEAGCPIIGDQKYGSKTDLGGTICLHHLKLTLPHPVTHELLTILSNSPYAKTEHRKL